MGLCEVDLEAVRKQKNREYQAKWAALHPEAARKKARKSMAKWRALHPEVARESWKKQREKRKDREDVKEKARKRAARWRACDPERAKRLSAESCRKWKEVHSEEERREARRKANAKWMVKPGKKELVRARNARWKKENAFRVRESRRRREARIVGNLVDYQAILDRDGMWCYLCGQPIVSRANLHFDHVIPLCGGGLHSAENIKPTHARCNLVKAKGILSDKFAVS